VNWPIRRRRAEQRSSRSVRVFITEPTRLEQIAAKQGVLFVPVAREVADGMAGEEFGAPVQLRMLKDPRSHPLLRHLVVKRYDGPTRDELEDFALHIAWMHSRLVHVHHEHPDVDYMRRLAEIADRLNGRPVTLIDRILHTETEHTTGALL
jgi:hypothetical protein